MKQILSLFSVFCLIFTLASCGFLAAPLSHENETFLSSEEKRETLETLEEEFPLTAEETETNTAPPSSPSVPAAPVTEEKEDHQTPDSVIKPGGNSSSDSGTQETPPQQSHSHSYTERVTKTASCTESGTKTFTCSCGKSYTESTAATGHNWGVWKTVTNPTVTSEGSAQRTCGKCSATETKTIAKLQGSTEIDNVTLQRIENGFLKLVNEERQRCGVSALSIDSKLESAAQVRSSEITTLFSHTRPNGTSCFTAVDEASYPYRTTGENICYTTHLPAGSYTYDQIRWTGSDAQIESAYTCIFNCFKNSPPHYSSMINGDFLECGIGITCIFKDSAPYFYVAHMFGTEM